MKWFYFIFHQLADFVKLPLEKAGGMIALIDVYCLFNRARGTGICNFGLFFSYIFLVLQV